MQEALVVKVTQIVTQVLRAKGIRDPKIEVTQPLFDEGLGMDSLDAATLAAMLDKEFHCDPYNAGLFPENVADIVQFYATRAS